MQKAAVHYVRLLSVIVQLDNVKIADIIIEIDTVKIGDGS